VLNSEDDDIERAGSDIADLPLVSEAEDLSKMERSALIIEEHEKKTKTESKQTKIFGKMTKKEPLPF